VEVKRRKLEKPDDDEKWSRNPIKLWNNADKMCKGDISGGKSKIQQSVVSRMLCKLTFPKSQQHCRLSKVG